MWSTRRSGCAASIPSRASLTTSAGSLMSFFMSGLRGNEDGGVAGRVLIDRRPRDGDERQGGGGAGKQFAGEVDRQLSPVHGAAPNLLDEHGTDCARRVDRSGRGRRDDDD